MQKRQEFMSSFTILLPAHSLFYDLVCEGELKKRDTSLFSCSASNGFDTYPSIPHFGHSSCVAWITSNTGRFQLDFLPSPDLTLLFISSSISRILRVVLNMQKKKDRQNFSGFYLHVSKHITIRHIPIHFRHLDVKDQRRVNQSTSYQKSETKTIN